MKQAIVIAFGAMISSSGCASAAQPIEESSFLVGKDVSISPTSQATTYEMWNSAPSRLISQGDVVTRLDVIDVEAAPVEEGRQLLAIILVGEFGTGIEPVAFRVSAPSARKVEIYPRSVVASTATFDLKIGQDVSVPLAVKPDGSVSLAGHALGVIK